MRSLARRARPPLAAADLLPVRRDFAFVLDAGIAAGDVVRAAQSADKELVKSVAVFDLFAGGALAEQGKKSLAEQILYRALDTKLQREVAVKVLPATLALDPNYVERFRSEGRQVEVGGGDEVLDLAEVYLTDDLGLAVNALAIAGVIVGVTVNLLGGETRHI